MLLLNEAQGAGEQEPSPGIPPHPVDTSLCSSQDRHLISVKLIVLCRDHTSALVRCVVAVERDVGSHSLQLCYG